MFLSSPTSLEPYISFSRIQDTHTQPHHRESVYMPVLWSSTIWHEISLPLKPIRDPHSALQVWPLFQVPAMLLLVNNINNYSNILSTLLVTALINLLSITLIIILIKLLSIVWANILINLLLKRRICLSVPWIPNLRPLSVFPQCQIFTGSNLLETLALLSLTY